MSDYNKWFINLKERRAIPSTTFVDKITRPKDYDAEMEQLRYSVGEIYSQTFTEQEKLLKSSIDELIFPKDYHAEMGRLRQSIGELYPQVLTKQEEFLTSSIDELIFPKDYLNQQVERLRQSIGELYPQALTEQEKFLTSSIDELIFPKDYLNQQVERLRQSVGEMYSQPLMEQARLLKDSIDNLILPKDYLTELKVTNEKVGDVFENSKTSLLKTLTESGSVAGRTILQRQQELDNRIRELSSPDQIYLPSWQVLDSLFATEALLNTQRLQSDIDSALQPLFAYQEFASQQLELVAAATSSAARRNRLALVDTAAELLEDMNSGFKLAAFMNHDSSAGFSHSMPPVNVYSELSTDLSELDWEKPEENFEESILSSKSGQITKLGRGIVRLVFMINTKAEREGKSAIFKPTNMGLLGCSVIPTQIAIDESSFYNIIDHLYFLLYEGSGDAGRLLEEAAKESLTALWSLKDLRRGARHDIDHGAKSEVKNKNLRIGGVYKSLVGAVLPRTRSEWVQAQIALYHYLLEMLESVWIGNDPSSEPA